MKLKITEDIQTYLIKGYSHEYLTGSLNEFMKECIGATIIDIITTSCGTSVYMFIFYTFK